MVPFSFVPLLSVSRDLYVPVIKVSKLVIRNDPRRGLRQGYGRDHYVQTPKLHPDGVRRVPPPFPSGRLRYVCHDVSLHCLYIPLSVSRVHLVPIETYLF